ncbi:MAG: OmpA family protein [Syntrophales bacterium]
MSDKRASAVSVRLADKGMAAERLQTTGRGDTMPIDSNGTTEGRANSRRVEFVKF